MPARMYRDAYRDRLRAIAARRQPEEFAPIRPAHPEVLAASADELIAAGWGSWPRWQIPADWRTRKPVGEPLLT